jgi:hypothetical protein
MSGQNFIFSVLLFVIPFSPAEANNKVGNGGNVVICRPKAPAKATARLLDFYEHELVPGAEGEDPVSIAGKKLDGLEEAAPALAALYRKRLREIKGEMELKGGVALTSVDDSKHLFTPADKKCQVKQIAIRRKNPGSDEKLFLVSKDLWELLDPANQAGLLLHEVIYEHFSKLGEEDSTKARRLNHALFAGKPGKEKFWTMIKEMRVPIYP